MDTASTSWPPCKVGAQPCYSREQRLGEGRSGPRGVWAGTGIVAPVRTELAAAGRERGKGSERGLAEGVGDVGSERPL